MSDYVAPNIQFEWMKTQEQLARLKAFADSFDHKVPSTKHPICMVKRDGRDCGFAQIYMGPVVFSSWHTDPNICHPRDVVEGFKNFAGWGKIEHGGGFVGVPTDAKTFLPHTMRKLGFYKTGIELYELKT